MCQRMTNCAGVVECLDANAHNDRIAEQSSGTETDSSQVLGETGVPFPIRVSSDRPTCGRLKELARTATTCSRLLSPLAQIIRRVEGRRPSRSNAPERITSALSRKAGPFPPQISLNFASENRYSSVASGCRLT